MRLIGIDAAKDGMVLAYPIKNKNNVIIMNSSTKITNNHIKKLNELSISTIYIDDNEFSDIELNEIIDTDLRLELEDILKKLFDCASKKKLLNFNENTLKNAAKELLIQVSTSNGSLINFFSIRNESNYIIKHSIDVAIMSILIGKHLQYNFDNLLDLTVGALLHDIGKYIDKNNHTGAGFKAAKDLRGISLRSNIIILQHHDNYKQNSNMHELSKIVNIINDYDNILHDNNLAISKAYQCYEQIVNNSGLKYDERIVKAFSKSIEIFPNGATVLLNTGEKAVVIMQNNNFPTRPITKVIGKDKYYNLLECLNITIDKMLQG